MQQLELHPVHDIKIAKGRVMSENDHSSLHDSAFDNDHRWVHDDQRERASISRLNSPKAPRTAFDDTHRRHEARSSVASYIDRPAQGPTTSYAFVFVVAAIWGFGIFGAIVLSLLF
jgi:hypothetical protein